MAQTGVQLGPESFLDTYRVRIQHAPELELPTGDGEGLGFGASWTIGRLERAGAERHDQNWDVY